MGNKPQQPKSFEGLDDIFGIDSSDGELIQSPQNFPSLTDDVDTNFPAITEESQQDTSLDEDILFVKNKLKNLISQSENFTGYAMVVAQSTQEAKDLTVVLESIKLQSSLLSKLITVQKKEPTKPKEEPKNITNITNQTAVFTGNANDVLKQIRETGG